MSRRAVLQHEPPATPPPGEATAPPMPPPTGWPAAGLGALRAYPGLRFLVMAAALVIVVAGMKAASPLIVQLLLGAFIAALCAPLFLWLNRRGVPAPLALVVLVVLLAGAGFLTAAVLDRAVAGLVDKLPQYRAALDAEGARLWAWLEARGAPGLDRVLAEAFDPGAVLRYVLPVADTLRAIVTNVLIVVLVAVFILLEASALPEKVRALPNSTRRTWYRINRVVADVRRFMLLKTVMSLLTGVLVGLWLALRGVDHPVLLGLLAFVLNYIPVVGSIVASLPGIALAFIDSGPAGAAVVAAGYVVVNVGVSNLLEPRFMGHGLDLSPLVVVLAVLFWGWVLGPVGMLLSVPLTTAAKLALEGGGEGARWVALLMSSRPKRRRGRPRPGTPPPAASA